jgi:thymidylate kinase
LKGQTIRRNPPIGPDGVGKTALRMLLTECNDGNIYIIERFTPSIYAYGKFYGRKLNMDYLYSIEKEFMKSFSLCSVFLRCDPEILYKRFIRGIHSKTFSLKEVSLIQEMMKYYIKNISILNWLIIDNTNLVPEEEFKIVVERFKL